MIAEHLSDVELVSVPSRKPQRFCRVLFLEEGALGAGGDDAPPLPSDALFCGGPGVVRELLAHDCAACALCVQGPGQEDPLLLRSCRERVLVVESQRTPYALYRELEEYFFMIEGWVNHMKTALLEGGGYQSLINCSEDVLKNFITMSNSDFRLLAYSQHVSIDDPTAKLLVEHGVHPQETIDLFRKYQVTRDWERQTKIEVKPVSELTTYPALDYIFRIQGSYFVHVVMHCNVLAPSPGLVDTFQLLIDHLGYYVRRSWNERLLLDQEPSRLFGDLIANSAYHDNALDQRLRGLSVPKTGAFTLLAFQLVSEHSDNQLLMFYTQQLKELCPWCHVGVHGSYVLVLDPLSKLVADKSRLRSFVNTHPCVIGASGRFQHLSDFAFAFRQAKAAINAVTSPGQSLASFYLGEQADVVCMFGDVFPAYVVDVARNSNQLVSHSVKSGIVARVVAYDEQHKTEDAKLLFFYLACERKASAACEALFLHRNTLLYHVDRMQKRFGFNLDDLHTRQRIMFEYLLYPASDLRT